jgi:hypothetical protein
VVDSFGGVTYRELVWTDESLGKAKLELSALYVLFVVGLATALLCLIEAIPSGKKPAARVSKDPGNTKKTERPKNTGKAQRARNSKQSGSKHKNAPP